MNREMKMITAGGVAGILSGSLGLLFGQVNGRGLVLGIFLAVGVIIIEKTSAQKLANGQYPDISKILIAFLASGILAGLLGYYTVLTNEISTDFGNIYLPYIFSYPKFILLISLYPLFILPAFFSKWKYLLTVFAGTCASIIIEMFRSGDIISATGTAIFTGFTFTLLWVLFVGLAGRRSKIQAG